MNYPTKETHPHLFGASKDDIAGWIQWMVDTDYVALKKDETPRAAVLDISRSAVCAYLINPRSLVRRQMPMAMDFLLLDKEEQEEVVARGFGPKNLS